jgi:hypothetical protein
MNKLISLDNYGVPVQLMYKRDITFKTRLGAFVSIASFIGILIYFSL